jgi:hypothetical protein
MVTKARCPNRAPSRRGDSRAHQPRTRQSSSQASSAVSHTRACSSDRRDQTCARLASRRMKRSRSRDPRSSRIGLRLREPSRGRAGGPVADCHRLVIVGADSVHAEDFERAPRLRAGSDPSKMARGSICSSHRTAPRVGCCACVVADKRRDIGLHAHTTGMNLIGPASQRR